ncbi:MAG TPA: hypothetical protein VHK01_05645 [Lacipirellulaceae bacterium]|nr:hypothetical protein [Lacipirellulaceae bacterium]
MAGKIVVTVAVLAASLSAASFNPIRGQVIAPSTWATDIVIDPQPRDTNGMPIGSPSSVAFLDWARVPLALTDPADNPSALNLIDIKDVKIANDNELLYIYASGHRMRTNGLFLAFDTDQNVATGFDIFGLQLVGSELGYVNDFVFDQRAPGVFNNNKPDPGGSCCTGGPLDINNGGAALYPGWDVEFEQREWGVPLDALWSVNEPFGPTFPNSTFNFILWTDQGLTDVTDVITYTLAPPPAGIPGDYNDDGSVDAADYVVWRKNNGAMAGYEEWRTNFGKTVGNGSGAQQLASSVPEPAIASFLIAAALLLPTPRAKD